MNKEEIEAAVKDQFDMDLCQFIKTRIENHRLYNYEIARILNVSGKLISSLMEDCGTKRRSRFARRFERDYGAGAVGIFKEKVENPDNSLSDVARHFGFSRENARQVFKKIYGYPYTEFHRKKRKMTRTR